MTVEQTGSEAEGNDPGARRTEPGVERPPARRFGTVTAAETGESERPDDLERAADIVASMADATLLRSVAAVILGFVALTIGSVAAGRGIVAATGVEAADAVTTGFLATNLAARLFVAAVAGYLTALAAPRRPLLHGGALAGLVAFLAVTALISLRAAGTGGDQGWYPVAMLFVGPVGVLAGAALCERRLAGREAAAVLALIAVGLNGCATPPDASPAADTAATPAPAVADPLRLPAERNLVSGHETFGAPGVVNVVVEIPAGTNAKWQAEKTGEGLEWELEDGEPRVIRYLPYPANYGLIPRTLLPSAMGGDGDPLDVLLLGPARERGAVVAARPIGVLRLLDGGEQDDKLLVVESEGVFSEIASLEDLRARFPGVVEIVATWFGNYKGPGEVEVLEASGIAAALEIIEYAAGAFEAWEACGALDDGQGHGPDPFGEEWWQACRRHMGREGAGS
ncbi:MAG: inorganic diphosphatase [Gemmatimonadota bacterium]|nr:inorganic diphosphatase [Gemmatimonadota bacterium]